MGKHNRQVSLSARLPSKFSVLSKKQRRDPLSQVPSYFTLHTLPLDPQYPHSRALRRRNEYRC